MSRKYPLNVTLRDGRKAVVLEEQTKTEFPLIGYTFDYPTTAMTWKLSGKFWGSRVTTPSDIVSGLDDPEPAPEASRTVKVRVMVGVMRDGRYNAEGWRDSVGVAEHGDLVENIEDGLDANMGIRYTWIEADVPLPDEAIPTVQGRVVEHGE